MLVVILIFSTQEKYIKMMIFSTQEKSKMIKMAYFLDTGKIVFWAKMIFSTQEKYPVFLRFMDCVGEFLVDFR